MSAAFVHEGFGWCLLWSTLCMQDKTIITILEEGFDNMYFGMGRSISEQA
jgi:hypothetical protein